MIRREGRINRSLLKKSARISRWLRSDHPASPYLSATIHRTLTVYSGSFAGPPRRTPRFLPPQTPTPGGKVRELQNVLESRVVDDRSAMLKRTHQSATTVSELARDVDSEFAKRHREYYLPLKGIKKEFGWRATGRTSWLGGSGSRRRS